MQSTSQSYYGIQLLDDLHTYFPAILYNPEQFMTVGDLLTYIQTRVHERFDLFTNARNQHTRAAPPRVQPLRRQGPLATTIPIRVDENLSNALLQEIFRSTRVPVAVNITESNSTRPRNYTAINPQSVASLLSEFVGIGENFMEPVPITPTQEQIENATILRGATTSDESSRCAICQDTYGGGQAILKIIHCNHEFHRGCIETWFQSNTHCPNCRWDIRDHS
jgi:hypothetical protein